MIRLIGSTQYCRTTFVADPRSNQNQEIATGSSLLCMQAPGVPFFALFLILCSMTAGCSTDDANDLQVTPTPVPVMHPATIAATYPAVTAPTTSAIAPLPVPTMDPIQVIPSERQVNLVLTKDRPTSEIHLLYQGGPGEIFTTRVMMRVYSTDIDFTEYTMSNGAKPIPGDEIIAPGTRGGDRCEVFVISAGTRYKVMDQKVYGGMYY